MFEKLQMDYDCPYCYNMVAKVMRENGLLRKKNRQKGLTQADKDAQKSDNCYVVTFVKPIFGTFQKLF
jgi:hypothetical protein